MGTGTGLLRQKAKSIIGKELDQGIIESIGVLSLQGNLQLGGDFRMLSEADIKNSLCEMDDDSPTFRRNMNGKIQESCIDHVRANFEFR